MRCHLQNQFSLSNDLNSVDADIYIITVGTPVDGKSKVPIIDYIEQVADSIGSVIKKNDLIILRSTVSQIVGYAAKYNKFAPL